MALHARAGKGSRISVGGTALNKAKWDVDDSADRLDTTNFESGGVGTSTVGIETAKYDASGIWDASANQFDSPPALFPQDALANLKFYISVADNTFWNFALACIFSAKNGAAVRELVTFAFSGESNGAITRPTGSF